MNLHLLGGSRERHAVTVSGLRPSAGYKTHAAAAQLVARYRHWQWTLQSYWQATASAAGVLYNKSALRRQHQEPGQARPGNQIARCIGPADIAMF